MESKLLFDLTWTLSDLILKQNIYADRSLEFGLVWSCKIRLKKADLEKGVEKSGGKSPGCCYSN